jgi:hypothetical protein
MTTADVLAFVGGLLLVWTLGYCGGFMILRIRKLFDQF